MASFSVFDMYGIVGDPYMYIKIPSVSLLCSSLIAEALTSLLI